MKTIQALVIQSPIHTSKNQRRKKTLSSTILKLTIINFKLKMVQLIAFFQQRFEQV